MERDLANKKRAAPEAAPAKAPQRADAPWVAAGIVVKVRAGGTLRQQRSRDARILDQHNQCMHPDGDDAAPIRSTGAATPRVLGLHNMHVIACALRSPCGLPLPYLISQHHEL